MTLLEELAYFLGILRPPDPPPAVPPEPPRPPRLVDFVHGCWGHNVQFSPRDIQIVGWGPLMEPNLEPGDVLLLPRGWRCTVAEVRYDDNVRDMWYATVTNWRRDVSE